MGFIMPKNSIITASAPGKLMLSGSYGVVHGHPAVVTAVNQRLYVTVEKNGEDVFLLNAPDLGLRAYSKTIDDLARKELPKGVRFIEHMYKRFLEKYPQDHGIVVTSQSDFSSSFGFGSSSAVTVAFAKALTTLYNIKMTNKELFDFCYQVIIDVQGVGSGFDIAAAIWGGTIYYQKPAAIVDQIPLSGIEIVVGYTGLKADTPTLIHMVNSRHREDSEKINKIFEEIGQTSVQLREFLSQSNFEEAGKCLTRHQLLVRQLGVSTDMLDNLTSKAVAAGALGATLSGAGGGDCMIALVETSEKAQVEDAIAEAGGEVISIDCNQEGVRLETNLTAYKKYEEMHLSSFQ